MLAAPIYTVVPYNGLFSLGQIFAKRWIFALEGNFAS